MAKILYLSCHSILEQEEVSLFHELGHEIFSPGAYVEPLNPGDATLRPGIPGLVYDPDIVDQWHKIAQAHPGEDGKDYLTKDFVDNFDCVVVMHLPRYIVRNWDVMKHKRVIWRTIGQSIASTEQQLKPYRDQGMEIVRYSPMEVNIPGFIGQDAMIRFYKDPEEYKSWTGHKERVITLGQSMKQRDQACNFTLFEQVTRPFDRHLFGPGNEDIGDWTSGKIPFDQLKQELRDNRVYFYTGTHPASYTLNFIEALMCFPENTDLVTDSGLKKIQHVSSWENGYQGDKVSGSRNNLVRINKKYENYFDGDLVTIKPIGFLDLTTTPNHPVATVQMRDIRERLLFYNGVICKKVPWENGIVYKNAEDVDIRDDYLVMPKHVPCSGDQVVFDIKPYYIKHTCPEKEINTIPFNKETAFLFGWYLAEGYGENAVYLSLNLTEELEIAEKLRYIIEKYTPYECTFKEDHERNSLTISFGGCVLARFFADKFGHLAHNKKIPDEIMCYDNPELIKIFVNSYISGDGSFKRGNHSGSGCTKYNHFGPKSLSCCTVSKLLILQLQKLLSSLHIIGKVIVDSRGGTIQEFPGGRHYKIKDRYILNITGISYETLTGDVNRDGNRFVERIIQCEKYFYVPVRTVTKKKYKGKTYNFSTTDGTYQVNNLLVHNCGIPIVAIGMQHGNASYFHNHMLYEVPFLLQHGINGFISDDPAQLQSYIQMLMNDDALAQSISQEGRKLAIYHFNKDMIKNAWKDYLERTI